MSSAQGKPTPTQALDLRLRRGSGVDAVMGPIAIAADDVASHVTAHRWDASLRQQWLEALNSRWQELPLSTGSASALEKLKDPACHIVMAGQQPALCGGPLLSTVKLLAATALASDLERRGIPAVTLFWVADEDHDVGELNPGHFRNGQPMEMPFDRGQRPISDLRHPSSERERMQQIEACLAGAPHTPEVRALLENAIDPSPSREFCQVLWSLLPEESWLPVFPHWLRQLQAPWIRRASDESEIFQELILKASREQESLGIPSPVAPRKGAPFFCFADEGQRVRPEQLAVAEAENLLADPQRLSADALLRGIIQDAIFEPSVVIHGATEWCYNLQTRLVRQQWKIPQPLWLPRPGLRPLEVEMVESLKELGIGVEGLSADLDLTQAIPSNRGELKRRELDHAAEDLLKRIEELSRESSSNPALQRKARRMLELWKQQLERLGTAIDHGLDLEVEAKRNRARQMLSQAFPGGTEPERSRNLCDLLAWHGPEMVEKMAQSVSASISRWDGRISALLLPALNPMCEPENSDDSQ